MSRSETYLQKAAESERKAAQAVDATVKRHHRNLAEAWKMMAARVMAQEPAPKSKSKPKPRSRARQKPKSSN